MPSGSKRKQTDEHGLNTAERLRGACIRRNEHTLQSVSLLKGSSATDPTNVGVGGL